MQNHHRCHKQLDIHKKCLVLLSGGIDSTTLAFWLKNQGYIIEALYFDYGQGQINSERSCAMAVAKKLNISLHIIETPLPSDSLRNTTSSQGPCLHLNDVKLFGDAVGMCIMATAFAFPHGFDSIALGINTDNVRAHPALNASFFRTIEKLASLWINNRIRVLTPFLQKDKTTVMRIGARLDVPYVDTWSCGVNIEKHCGKCVECLARKEAFKEIRLPDPTEYEC